MFGLGAVGALGAFSALGRSAPEQRRPPPMPSAPVKHHADGTLNGDETAAQIASIEFRMDANARRGDKKATAREGGVASR